MTTYFDHPYCSNSTLSALKNEIYGIDRGDPYNAYRLGSLFDAVVTEPEILDLIRMQIIGKDGYTFTKAEYANNKKMHAALLQDHMYKSMIACKGLELQKELYIEGVKFEWEGFAFTLNMRAKLDFFLPGLVSDLKSTACISQRAFEAAAEQFDYWRQMVLYCRLTGAKRAVIFAVSKVNHKVFKVQIQEGDERWVAGERQLNELTFLYYLSEAT